MRKHLAPLKKALAWWKSTGASIDNMLELLKEPDKILLTHDTLLPQLPGRSAGVPFKPKPT